jgi:hypothetical protein
MVLGVVFGLLVWFALPLFFEEFLKKKKYIKTLRMCCKICGIAIVVMTIVKYFI